MLLQACGCIHYVWQPNANKRRLSGFGVGTEHHAGYLWIRQTRELNSCGGEPLIHAVVAFMTGHLIRNEAANSCNDLVHLACMYRELVLVCRRVELVPLCEAVAGIKITCLSSLQYILLCICFLSTSSTYMLLLLSWWDGDPVQVPLCFWKHSDNQKRNTWVDLVNSCWYLLVHPLKILKGSSSKGEQHNFTSQIGSWGPVQIYRLASTHLK